MGNVKIDLRNYRPSFGDKVDAGRYLATVTSVTSDRSKAGNDMLVVWLEIASGPFEGKALRTNLTLTEKAMFKVVEFLSALGYKTERKVLNLNTDQWVRKQVIVDVEERSNEYNGNVTVRSEIGAVMRATPELVATMKAESSSRTAAPAAESDLPAEDEVVNTDESSEDTADTSQDASAEEGVTITPEDDAVDLDEIENL